MGQECLDGGLRKLGQEIRATDLAKSAFSLKQRARMACVTLGHQGKSKSVTQHPASQGELPTGSVTSKGGKLGEYSDANPGLRSSCPNIHPKNVWMKIRIHFGDGFSGSSEEGCFFGSFAFLPLGFGFSCSSPDSCFSSLRRLFSASLIWILSRRRVSSSAAASRCLEFTSA